MEPEILIIDACQYSEHYDICLLDALAAAGGNITFATTKTPNGGPVFPNGVKLRNCFFYLARLGRKISASNLLRQILRGIEYPFDLLALMVYIWIRRVKVVHFMWLVLPRIDLVAIRILKATGCRVVYTAHNPFPHELKPSDIEKFSAVYRTVDHIVALTDYTRQELVTRAGIPSAKISVVPHGDFAYILNQVPANEPLAQKIKNLAGGRRVVAFLGIIRPYKGLKYFIQAIPLIKQRCPDTFFLIAGTARFTNKAEYEELLARHSNPSEYYVDFRYVSDADLKAYLSVTDVLVQPYVTASQSGNTVQAYADGIPVISTNVGGLGEMVEDGVSGYVVPPENPQEIAGAVEKCFKEDNYQKLSAGARRLANEQYAWSTIADQMIRVYNEKSRDG